MAKKIDKPQTPALRKTAVMLSLADAKQIVAEKWDKNDWAEVQRDYEYGLGLMKLIDFEELMDNVAEVYKANGA
jgi:hypothetical protein